MMEWVEVQDRRSRELFERVPELLHGGHPVFAPPFPGSIAKMLKPDSAFHRNHGEIKGWVVKRNGKPVGRIAAITNRTHNAYYADQVGFFGFFDCENEQDTAAALLDRAAGHLRTNGMQLMRGPYNPSINDECGLLTDGFDTLTCNGLPWSRSTYKGFLEDAGFASARKLFGYHLPLAGIRLNPRVQRVADRVAQRSNARIRPMNLKEIEPDLEVVRDVYNDTLSRNWGFIPITTQDLLEAADELRAIADPELLMIAEKDGEPAGVALTLPNFNEILTRVKDVPPRLRLPAILWQMKTYRIQTCRLVVYGIVPKFRDKGLHGWLMQQQFLRAQERFYSAHLGWIEETNTEVDESAAVMGATHNRLWEIFEKAL